MSCHCKCAQCKFIDLELDVLAFEEYMRSMRTVHLPPGMMIVDLTSAVSVTYIWSSAGVPATVPITGCWATNLSVFVFHSKTPASLVHSK